MLTPEWASGPAYCIVALNIFLPEWKLQAHKARRARSAAGLGDASP
jgi:hypothetical protein